jgi:predicted dithiol-disulfide oxidoreductase (DUF899 family)
LSETALDLYLTFLLINEINHSEIQMTNLHDKRYPGEDADYRAARNALLEAELALDEQVNAVAAMRQNLPVGGPIPDNYTFDTLENGELSAIHLSDLFEAGKPNLFLYSFMFGPDDEQPCPACTSLIDGFNGIADHIKSRMNLAVAAKGPIERLSEFARGRGWSGIRLLSSANNSFNRDYFAEMADGTQIPAANIFVNTDGAIRHFYGAEMLYVDRPGQHPRHVDRIWPIWNILDLTPEGRGDWFPRLSYG